MEVPSEKEKSPNHLIAHSRREGLRNVSLPPVSVGRIGILGLDSEVLEGGVQEVIAGRVSLTSSIK